MTTCPYPRFDALRPSRPRTAPHRTSDLPRARHPHGRRPRPVRHRRRHQRRPLRRHQRRRWQQHERRRGLPEAPGHLRASAQGQPAGRRGPHRPDQAARPNASIGENYNQTQQAYTAKGLAELRQASAAWQRYLATKPAKPDADTANLMVQAYGPARPQAIRQGRRGAGDRHRQPQGDGEPLRPARDPGRGGQTGPQEHARRGQGPRAPPKDQRKQLKSAIDLQKSQLKRPAARPATERLSRSRAATIPRRAPVAQLAEQRTLIRRFQVRFLAGAWQRRRARSWHAVRA